MTSLDSILKHRDITLPTKVHLVKAMIFPVVMYGCASWTIKKAEHQRVDAFELWCWRRLLRVSWTARRSNQSILLPSIFPSTRAFSNESTLHQAAKYWSFSSASVLPMNIQDWFPLGWTGWISLQSKGLSRVFSNTTVQKHQFLVLSLLYDSTLTSLHLVLLFTFPLFWFSLAMGFHQAEFSTSNNATWRVQGLITWWRR